jgi:hypothetical protein
MAQGRKIGMRSTTEIMRRPDFYRQLTFLGFSLASAIVLAQAVDHMDPGASFDTRQTDAIFDSAGEWRQPPPVENSWRSIPDETVQNRRFHFGSDSAYEEMRYRDNDGFSFDMDMGTSGSDYRPSTLFRYNY